MFSGTFQKNIVIQTNKLSRTGQHFFSLLSKLIMYIVYTVKRKSSRKQWSTVGEENFYIDLFYGLSDIRKIV